MEERPLRDPLAELQNFIDERWDVAQPKFYPGGPSDIQVPPELTASEAKWFLAAVRSWLEVDDERKLRSDRFPPLKDGSPRGYNFFEASGRKGEEEGRLRTEWIVHFAAAERLCDEFGWPLEHLVFESPKVLDSNRGREILKQDAIDILLLRERRTQLTWPMTQATLGCRIIVESKFSATGSAGLTGMIQKMRECNRADHAEHKKCEGLQVFGPDFFLGVAASETWCLFPVEKGEDGRRVLAEEIPPANQPPHLRFGP